VDESNAHEATAAFGPLISWHGQKKKTDTPLIRPLCTAQLALFFVVVSRGSLADKLEHQRGV
jgi:hypothetical protein